VERHGYLGGAATAGSVLTYCGFFDRSHTQVVAGVGGMFLDRMAEDDLYLTHTSADSGNKVVLLDLETTKRALDDVVGRAGVELFLHSYVHSATVDGDRVTAVELAHPGGSVRLIAAAFVDSSGDGALLEATGIPVRVSSADKRQASTLVMRAGGVREDADLSREGVTKAIRAYQSESGAVLPRDHGTAVRLPVSREIMLLLADQHLDMLDPGGSTRAELDGRALSQHYFRALKSALHGWESSFLAATGPEIGVRETRRMIGAATVTAEHVAAGTRRPEDVVARGGWPMEGHVSPGVTSYAGIRDDSWYDIPYGSIVSAALRNLWAGGRLVSSDERAFASVRVMGTAFGTGHACGVAAAHFARSGSVDVAAVQRQLRQQGALL
jgi:hypothetical protein